MKVEYVRSAFGVEPDMIISNSKYRKSFDSDEEYNYLRFAVDGFSLTHGFENQFKHRDYDFARRCLDKSGSVLFVVREKQISPLRSVRWCEIHLTSNGGITGLITSEDGDYFFINKEVLKTTNAKKEVTQ